MEAWRREEASLRKVSGFVNRSQTADTRALFGVWLRVCVRVSLSAFSPHEYMIHSNQVINLKNFIQSFETL